jgi:hypothetical protein
LGHQSGKLNLPKILIVARRKTLGIPDDYGKRLLASILGKRWVTRGNGRSVEMAGVRAALDGIILSEDSARVECAVEIEAKIYKQIRGAILDLAWHSAPRKMLVMIPAQPQLGTEEKARAHLMYVWQKLTTRANVPFELVVLSGTGTTPMDDDDRLLLTDALKKLDLIQSGA